MPRVKLAMSSNSHTLLQYSHECHVRVLCRWPMFTISIGRVKYVVFFPVVDDTNSRESFFVVGAKFQVLSFSSREQATILRTTKP